MKQHPKIPGCPDQAPSSPFSSAVPAVATASTSVSKLAAPHPDSREAISGRLERRDGTVVDCTTVPLPDGATLVTFHDVTDSVNVERALLERNEALEDADRI